MDTNPFPVTDAALDAPLLRGLLDDWTRLRAAADRGPSFVSRVRELARRVVTQRARLFDRNARLQVEQPGSAEIEANQTAIKCATTMLSEMTGAIGHASMPDQER
jgi:hypothetical protein